MTKAGTKKNYFYTIVKESIDVAVPLILVPYSSRILGADGIGQYSYVYSIVYYFMIVSMLNTLCALKHRHSSPIGTER